MNSGSEVRRDCLKLYGLLFLGGGVQLAALTREFIINLPAGIGVAIYILLA